MKSFLFLVFAVAFLVCQMKAQEDPEAGPGDEDDVPMEKNGARLRTPIQCGSVGGTCRRTSCTSNEHAVGNCFPGVSCCKPLQ